MLMRFDPFREFDRLDRLAQAVTPSGRSGMSMDAYRRGDDYIVHFDLPGVDPASIDLTVEKNALNVTAERTWQPADDVEIVASERLHGRFSRQLFLGEGLDADRIEATYEAGVLTVRIPVAEKAKPRKISIGGGSEQRAIGVSA
jgi:HSP20 family protein